VEDSFDSSGNPDMSQHFDYNGNPIFQPTERDVKRREALDELADAVDAAGLYWC
jgi:hypothetical protein